MQCLSRRSIRLPSNVSDADFSQSLLSTFPCFPTKEETENVREERDLLSSSLPPYQVNGRERETCSSSSKDEKTAVWLVPGLAFPKVIDRGSQVFGCFVFIAAVTLPSIASCVHTSPCLQKDQDASLQGCPTPIHLNG